MDDRDLEVARLTFLKDELIAEHESGQTWWQVVLGAGLAACAFALYTGATGFILGAFAEGCLGFVLVVAAAVLRAAYRRAFRRRLFGLAGSIGRLKREEEP